MLENSGPRQSIILAKLSGGPLEKTGVMQGMSGSPVYINGKLLGAVALGFAFSKDAIAGIRPIGEMIEGPHHRHSAGTPRPLPGDPWRQRTRRDDDSVLIQRILTRNHSGLRPSASARLDSSRSRPFPLDVSPQPSASLLKPLLPGSMISVQLLNGDMSVGSRRHSNAHRRQTALCLWPSISRGGRHRSAFRQKLRSGTAPQRQHIVQNRIKRGLDGQHHNGHQYRRVGRIRPPTLHGPAHHIRRRREDMKYRMEMVRDRFLSPCCFKWLCTPPSMRQSALWARAVWPFPPRCALKE